MIKMRATDRLRLTLSDKQGTSDTPEEPKLHTELIKKKNPIQNLLQYYFFAVAGQKLPTHSRIYKELFSPTRRKSQQQMALPSQGPELNISYSRITWRKSLNPQSRCGNIFIREQPTWVQVYQQEVVLF